MLYSVFLLDLMSIREQQKIHKDDHLERAEELFFNSGVMELQSDTMTDDKDMAMRFVQITHERMIAMYEEWRKEVIEFL